MSRDRNIPRVWEVDWALPPSEGGTPWAAYRWALATARDLGVGEVSIVGATYERLGDLDVAIGAAEAGRLRVGPHRYGVGGIVVRGVSRRGGWYTRGAVLVAWANDQVLAEVESQRPAAIAAVAEWPDRIAHWRSIYRPQRIGQVRAEPEAQFDTAVIAELDPRAAEAIDAATAWVNTAHAVLDVDERESVAGALVALRGANVPVDRQALRGHP